MSLPRDRELEDDAEHSAHHVGFECWGEALSQEGTGAVALTAHGEGAMPAMATLARVATPHCTVENRTASSARGHF
jgi:hypothetical protein